MDSQVSAYLNKQFIEYTIFSSTVYDSEEVELTGNTLNGKLFDASVVSDIDQAHVALHDMMTCEVTMDGTDFEKRIEKNILEQIGDFKTIYNCSLMI